MFSFQTINKIMLIVILSIITVIKQKFIITYFSQWALMLDYLFIYF